MHDGVIVDMKYWTCDIEWKCMNSKRDTKYLLKLIYMFEHYVHPFLFFKLQPLLNSMKILF